MNDEDKMIENAKRAHSEWLKHKNSGVIDSVVNKATQLSECCMKDIFITGDDGSWTREQIFSTDDCYFTLTVKVEITKK